MCTSANEELGTLAENYPLTGSLVWSARAEFFGE